MKRFSSVFISVFGFIGLFGSFLVCQSCREDLEGTIPVIKEELVGEYLANKPELFSEFTRMLDTSGVMGLLNAYGIYTVFAPTNEAVRAYYRTLKDDSGHYSITSMSQMTLADIKEFCYNHIIKGDTIKTKTLREATLGSQSMSERFITVSFKHDSIMINNNSLVILRDIERHNGIIHVVNRALSPANLNIGDCFEADDRFSIYVHAMKLTGLDDIMNTAIDKDLNYDFTKGYEPNGPKIDQYNPESKPKSRKFGYTILAVSDADLKKCIYNIPEYPGLADGIDNIIELEQLAKYYYSRQFNHDADDIAIKTDRRNYLNRFMSYHCLDRLVMRSRFIKDLFTPHHYPEYAMREYVETMLDNTILEVMLDLQGKVITNNEIKNDLNSEYGVFNYDDPVQGAMLLEGLSDLPKNGSLNGIFHGITKPIMYSEKLSSSFSSKRLRIDAATFFPELTTNNLRGSNPTADVNTDPRSWVIDDVYLDGIEASPNTRLSYVGACGYWENYQGDMFMVRGSYNITFKTCPIPAGTYEVRFGFKSTTDRGIAQLYFDSIPCGIPLDLAIKAIDPSIGSITPESDAAKEAGDEFGYENDKMMHNRGYMKGSCTYQSVDKKYWPASSARKSDYCLRRVLGIYTFDKTEKHRFTAINLGSSTSSTEMQFMIDYLEFCPLEIIEKEDIE